MYQFYNVWKILYALNKIVRLLDLEGIYIIFSSATCDVIHPTMFYILNHTETAIYLCKSTEMF